MKLMPLRLALFDLDGTLKLERDPYVYLHRRLGTWEQAQAYFEKGLRGQIPYAEWLRLDASLWVGVKQATLERLLAEDPYLPGAPEGVRELKRRGLAVAVISTGPSFHADLVARELGVDVAVANEILFRDGRVSGETRMVVSEDGKGEVARMLQVRFGVGIEGTLAVGDGEADVGMFERAAVGVALATSSQRARETARIVIEQPDLRGLIPLIEALDPGLLPPVP
jgi:HAD superfamily PSPase-like hydrolase